MGKEERLDANNKGPSSRVDSSDGLHDERLVGLGDSLLGLGDDRLVDGLGLVHMANEVQRTVVGGMVGVMCRVVGGLSLVRMGVVMVLDIDRMIDSNENLVVVGVVDDLDIYLLDRMP